MRKELLVLGVILIGIALAGSFEYRIIDERKEFPIPPMGTATGWAPLPVPDVMGIADVHVSVTWDEETHWLGVTSIEEAERCDPDSSTRISVKCGGDDIEFEAGGPSTGSTTIEWDVISGSWYACVGQNSGELSLDSTLSADISVTASMAAPAVITLIGVGGALIVAGLLLGRQ